MSNQENEFKFVKYIKDDEGFILGSEFFLKGIEPSSNIGIRRITIEDVEADYNPRGVELKKVNTNWIERVEYNFSDLEKYAKRNGELE